MASIRFFAVLPSLSSGFADGEEVENASLGFFAVLPSLSSGSADGEEVENASVLVIGFERIETNWRTFSSNDSLFWILE